MIFTALCFFKKKGLVPVLLRLNNYTPSLMFTPFIHFKMLSMSLFPGSIIFQHFSITLSPFASSIFYALFDLFRHRSFREGENQGIYAGSDSPKPTGEWLQMGGNKSFPYSHIYKKQSKFTTCFKNVLMRKKDWTLLLYLRLTKVG